MNNELSIINSSKKRNDSKTYKETTAHFAKLGLCCFIGSLCCGSLIIIIVGELLKSRVKIGCAVAFAAGVNVVRSVGWAGRSTSTFQIITNNHTMSYDYIGMERFSSIIHFPPSTSNINHQTIKPSSLSSILLFILASRARRVPR